MLALTPQRHERRARRRTAQSGPGAERLCAVTRAVKPVDELIRFVVGPDGVVPDLKRKLPGRGLWITADRRRIEGRGGEECLRPRLQARGCASRRAGGARPSGCWCVRRSMRSPSPARPAGRVAGFAKVEAALGRERHRRPGACVGRRRRRRRQARRRAAAARGRRRDRRHPGFHLGPIGFGIGPVKCGTCSPACRACK